MENTYTSIVLIVSALLCITYLFANILLQVRAKERLVKQLKKDRKMFEENFIKDKEHLEENLIKYKKVLGELDEDLKYEILICLLREEISTLKESTDKNVMKKTLDRKSFHNQKKFAIKILSDTGMIKSLGLKV